MSSARDGTVVVTTRRALEGLAGEWDVLAAPAGLPMLSHDWVLSCAEHLHDEDALRIVTVRARGVLTGAAPLVAVVTGGVTRLEFVGGSSLYEPSDLLYDTDQTLDTLLGAVVAARRPLVLSRIPSRSPVGARLRSLSRGRAVTVVKSGVDALAVPIESEWREFLAGLSSRERYDLKRARRRTEDSGRVTVRMLSPRPDDVAGLFDDLVRVEAAGWKTRNGSSLAQRHRLRRFFLAYATRAARTGQARFAFLDVGDRPIAAQLSVEYAGRMWVLKIGYDEAWSRCSPGWQLLAETMRDAFERKLRSYEFLGSDEPWLHRWGTEARPLSTLVWYPATVLGLYGLAADTVGRVRARVARRPHPHVGAGRANTAAEGARERGERG